MKTAKVALLAGLTLLFMTSAMKEARGGNFVILKEGTLVTVKLTEDFDAAAMKEGGKVPMAVAEKVKHEGSTLIDAGAAVEASFMPGNTKNKGAGLLKISSLQTTDGQDVTLRATQDVSETDEGSDNNGLSLISIPAEHSRMPKGTFFRVYLSETYFIED